MFNIMNLWLCRPYRAKVYWFIVNPMVETIGCGISPLWGLCFSPKGYEHLRFIPLLVADNCRRGCPPVSSRPR